LLLHPKKQVKRAQECRQLQDKLISEQPLTPQRGEEIGNTLKVAGCTTDAAALGAFDPSRS
jgi:hypothetical protein